MKRRRSAPSTSRRKTNTFKSKKPKVKLAETDLAAYVIKHLQEEGWEVYQEIQIRRYGAIADIVAVKDGEVMVVETKTSFGLGVLGQAAHWKRFTHYSAIAVPKAKNHTKARQFGRQVAWKFGIGIFAVRPNGQVSVPISPEKNPGAPVDKILDVLTEDHKTYAKAGSKGGGHLTQYKVTCRRLTELVQAKPGVPLQEAVKKIDHHYASDKIAINTLGKHIVRFNRIDTLYAEYDGDRKVHRLYYRATPPSPFPPRRKTLEDSAKSKI